MHIKKGRKRLIEMEPLAKEQRYIIEPLFQGWNETMIWSYLEGCMGEAWVDNTISPNIGLIMVHDFGFLAGNSQLYEAREIAGFLPKDMKECILIPQNEYWGKVIEEVYQEKSQWLIEAITRYAIKKEYDVFQIEKLHDYINLLSEGYKIVPIDQTLYDVLRAEVWSYDLVSIFEQYKTFIEAGCIGYVVLKDNRPVSGVSTYSYYKKGIEIEIDTHPDYRRKGLALACASRFIIECLSRNLYPSWDAMNMESVSLAEKLGYHLDKPYQAYFIKST